MIRDLVQTTLDSALYPDVLSYWQRKTGDDTDEYIVYRLAGDSGEDYADDVALTKSASITVNYYYRSDMILTSDGRAAVEAREGTIETALASAGIIVPAGPFDAGDVDDTGYMVTVFEAQYWRVV